MKMSKAMDIINRKPEGFMVSLEWIDERFLRSDHFPDNISPAQNPDSRLRRWLR